MKVLQEMQGLDVYGLLLIMLILFLISSLLRTLLERRRVGKEEYETKTLIKCPKCNYSEERNFQVGDYVLKPEKKCPKCGETMRIHRIYAVKIASRK